MQNFKIVKKQFIAILVAAAFLAFSSCSKEDHVFSENKSMPLVVGDTPLSEMNEDCVDTVTLFAGQHLNAGNVLISSDAGNVYIEISLTDGWVLNESHLFAGDSADLPLGTDGNPQIGLFPYTATHNGETNYTYSIPLDSVGECFKIAIHASVYLLGQEGNVVQSETAWGEGDQINEGGGSWAMFFDYCLKNCGCVWPITSFEMFGGQTTYVGSLDVMNDDEFLYVQFHFQDGWYAGATHLYVGLLSALPTNASNVPPPGQFPYVEAHKPAQQIITYRIPLTDLDSCFIIAAHGEALLFDEQGNQVQEETSWSYGTAFPDCPRWGWYSTYCLQACE